jgi:hypothetical protein
MCEDHRAAAAIATEAGLLSELREQGLPPAELKAAGADWAVHVALVSGGELVAGAVALPARGLTLSTAAPAPSPAPTEGRVRLLVSRTRPTEHATALAAALDAELVPMGPAGAKVRRADLADTVLAVVKELAR